MLVAPELFIPRGGAGRAVAGAYRFWVLALILLVLLIVASYL